MRREDAAGEAKGDGDSKESKSAAASRRRARGKFKGSVFVEFASMADATKFLELDPKPKFEESGEPLVVMTKYVILFNQPPPPGDTYSF